MPTNLIETATFDPVVYEIQTSDKVLGGDGGIANAQAQALADRTQWLKAQIATINQELIGITGPTYVNSSQAVVPGPYLVDTSAGTLTLTLPATPTKGQGITFIDAKATWGTTTWTIAHNGNTIMTQLADLIVNLSDQMFTLWYNGSDWRLV